MVPLGGEWAVEAEPWVCLSVAARWSGSPQTRRTPQAPHPCHYALHPRPPRQKRKDREYVFLPGDPQLKNEYVFSLGIPNKKKYIP